MTHDSAHASAVPVLVTQAQPPGEPTVPKAEPTRPLPAASAVLVGVLAAVVGLAPWLLTGMTLPLQNIWQAETLPDDMPLALLPLSQYYLVASAAMVVVGAALAGATVRVATRLGRPLRAWLVVAGAVAVQAVALTQSAWTLHGGLEDSSRARVYLWGMIAGVAVAIVVGLMVTVGIGRAKPPAATIAITVAALALTQWLPTVLHPIGSIPLQPLPRVLTTTVVWLPFVVAGLAIGWCGFASVRRALASVVSLATLWIGSAAVSAFSYAIGSRIYLQHPSELWPAFKDAFRMGLTSFDLPRQMVLTFVIAVIVAATMYGLRRIERGSDEPV